MNLIFRTILIALLLQFCSCSQQHVSEEKILKDLVHKLKEDRINYFIKNYERFFALQLKLSGCPGAAVAIVADSSVVWTKGFGKRSVNKIDQINEHTVFRLGSLSKGISAILTGKIIQEGKLNWDDYVQQFIPNFQLSDSSQAHRIKIRNLLSHSTGLPRHTFTNLIEDGLLPINLVDRLKDIPLIGKEGESFAYQNFTYALVEYILQQRTSLGFDDLLKNEILFPAGMSDASSSSEGFISSGNFAMPHHMIADGTFQELPLNNKYYNAASAGGINASIYDMSRWLKVLLGQCDSVVDEAVLAEVFRPEVATEAERRFKAWHTLTKSYYGLGWRIMSCGDRNIIYHGGSVNDYRTEIAIDENHHIGICVLFNGQTNLAGKVIPEFMELYFNFFPEFRKTAL